MSDEHLWMNEWKQGSDQSHPPLCIPWQPELDVISLSSGFPLSSCLYLLSHTVCFLMNAWCHLELEDSIIRLHELQDCKVSCTVYPLYSGQSEVELGRGDGIYRETCEGEIKEV